MRKAEAFLTFQAWMNLYARTRGRWLQLSENLIAPFFLPGTDCYFGKFRNDATAGRGSMMLFQGRRALTAKLLIRVYIGGINPYI